MCTGAIPADRLPCRYPSVRMMAVSNPRAMKIPAEKRAFPDLNPLPKIPLELIRLHALTARGAVREHLFRFLVSPLCPRARMVPMHGGTRRELTSNHTGNWSESWQSARKCQCGRYGKRPRRNLADRIFAASVSGRTSGCAHSKQRGWTLGAKVHNCSVTVWRNGSMLSRRFCAHIPPCVCS